MHITASARRFTPGSNHPHLWYTRRSGDRACLTCEATAPPASRGTACPQRSQGHDWWPGGPGLESCFYCGELREAAPDDPQGG